jgi:hypothetical protein
VRYGKIEARTGHIRFPNGLGRQEGISDHGTEDDILSHGPINLGIIIGI